MIIDNPCKYFYVESDDLSSLQMSEDWLSKMREFRQQILDKFTRAINTEGHRFYVLHDRADYYLEGTKTSNLAHIIHQRRTPEQEKTTLEYCHSKCTDIFKTALPNAFEALDNTIRGPIDGFALVLINSDSNYRAGAHFHPHSPIDKTKDSRTVTVVVPYKVVEPSTSYVKFQYNDQSVDKISGLDMDIVRDNILRTEPDPDLPIQSIKMPDAGEYLLIDFNATKCFHWVDDNGCKNEYLCLVVETFLEG